MWQSVVSQYLALDSPPPHLWKRPGRVFKIHVQTRARPRPRMHTSSARTRGRGRKKASTPAGTTVVLADAWTRVRGSPSWRATRCPRRPATSRGQQSVIANSRTRERCSSRCRRPRSLVLDVACTRIPRVRWDRVEHAAAALMISESSHPARSAEALPVLSVVEAVERPGRRRTNVLTCHLPSGGWRAPVMT